MNISTQKMLVEAIKGAQSNKIQPYTTTATVTSIDDNGTVYVQIPGSDYSTPVKVSTVSVSKGDVVNVVVSHDDTHITGNRSDVAVTATDAKETAEEVAKEVINQTFVDVATVDQLKANKAEVKELVAEKADITFANVIALEASKAIIENLLKAGSIITEDIEAVTGEFTNYLTGVNISGDLINAGTISTERLIIKSSDSDDGILFAINDIGELDQTKLSAEELKRLTLDGKLITAGTITANKISVEDLSAFGATIGGFIINEAQIKSINENIVLNSNGSFKMGGLSYNSDTNELGLDMNTVITGGDGVSKSLGESLSFSEVKYGLSTSETECTVTEWQNTMPARENNSYIWQRIIYHYANGSDKTTDVCIQGSDGNAGEDATILQINSSRGTVFKNNAVSTVLSVVIFHGSKRITDAETLKEVFGSNAYIEWSWQHINDEAFGVILSSDERLSDDGFTFTLSPEDVNAKVTFLCELKD